MKERKKTYRQKQHELLEHCRLCTAYNSPTPECCDECSIGKKLCLLEKKYSDISKRKL